MLGSMRTLALDYLFQELDGGFPPNNLENWYQNIRVNSTGKLFPFLVEDTEKIEKVFVIKKSYEENAVELFVMDMTPEISQYLPFVKPSGNMSAQIQIGSIRNFLTENWR